MAPAAPADPQAPAAEASGAEQALPASSALPAGIAFQLPSFYIPVAPLPQHETGAAASAVLTAVPAGIAGGSLAEATNPPFRAMTQPVLQPSQPQPSPQLAAPQPDAQVPVRAEQREAPSHPVLAVPATPPDAPAPAVTLLPAQTSPVAKIATGRVRIALTDGQENPPLPLDQPIASRASLADRAVPVLPAMVAVNPEAQPQVATSPAVSDPSPAQTAAAPRQDFAALVERLIEARDASSTQSVHAAIAHADFGQVSLHFQQDGKNLTVGMSSADPEFAVAVQAAMPAEAQSQSKSHSQSQGQSTGGSSLQHNEAGGQGNGAAADSQTRSIQTRNSRAGANPSPATASHGLPKHRNGIFA